MFTQTSRQRSTNVVAEAGPTTARPYFEIYRADEVSLTSTLFGGGDWRWRLCAAVGVVTAQGGGYATEIACKSAVASLRRVRNRRRSSLSDMWRRRRAYSHE